MLNRRTDIIKEEENTPTLHGEDQSGTVEAKEYFSKTIDGYSLELTKQISANNITYAGLVIQTPEKTQSFLMPIKTLLKLLSDFTAS